MSTYLALARQWRPRTFDALLGQALVKQALMNALTQQRLHHAYLFTGTHGTGKTTAARLFAKALCCETGISATPCLTCATCVSIDQGSFVDLLEIDGASKTRVEETRDLLENVQYAPVQGRFKIYLIDEVHMLSLHSCNALLKTLEEPPEHVKFLLATTDPQKLPVTVLSRCLQFHLKPIEQSIIFEQLMHIVQHEGFQAEEAGIRLIAEAARGSLRDALSLLEQAFACASAGMIATTLVRSLLGYTQQDYIDDLLTALYQRDADACFSVSQAVGADGGHYTYVLTTLMRALHQIACAQVGSIATGPGLSRFVTAFAPETIQLFYQIVLKGLKELPDAPSVIIGFEMILLRLLAFQPARARGGVEPALAYEAHAGVTAVSPDDKETVQGESTQPIPQTWMDWINQLNLSGLVLQAAKHAALDSLSDNRCVLTIQSGHRSLFTPKVLQALSQAMSQACQRPMQVELSVQQAAVVETPAKIHQRQQAAKQTAVAQQLSKDPVFQSLQQQFDAQWVPVSTQEI